MAKQHADDELALILEELEKVCGEMLHLLKKAKEKEVINELVEFREGKKKREFLKKNNL